MKKLKNPKLSEISQKKKIEKNENIKPPLNLKNSQ